ncbi:MAG: protein BatD [Cytophagales bacterium]|nr:protein BatD [Cytophagales bacterium]
MAKLHPLQAQQVSIELGPNQIPQNQAFTITITSHNEQLTDYDRFPDIPGFQKIGTSSQSSTNVINGRVSMSQSIVQQYQAQKPGKFVLPAFEMTVNGKKISSPGKTITVTEPVQQRANDPFGMFDDPFDSFFGRPRQQPQYDFVEVQDASFFSLLVDKEHIYVGEGVNVQLAFSYANRINRLSTSVAISMNSSTPLSKR